MHDMTGEGRNLNKIFAKDGNFSFFAFIIASERVSEQAEGTKVEARKLDKVQYLS
jgi:hypothetical protein